MKLFYIMMIALFVSCAPSGIENDNNYQKDKYDMSNKVRDEEYYIDLASGIGALDQDTIGDYPKAILYLDSALKINPQNSKALRIKAYLVLLKEEPKQALEIINKAIQSNAKDYNSYVTRANIFLVLDNRDKALNDYYTAVSIDSLNGKIWETIGYLEIDKGNKLIGCKYLRKARALGYLPQNRSGDSLICK